MSKILVLGGSRGIGESLVRVLRAQGKDVVFTYCRNEARAKEIEAETGARCLAYDQNSAETVARLCDFVRDNDIDGLVNNAAEKYKRQTFLDTDLQELLDYVTRGTLASMKVCQAFARGVESRKAKGSIVHVLSSVVLGYPPDKQSSYVALKYLWMGLFRCQAVEFKNLGVRVNAVSPGMAKTDYVSDLPDRLLKMYEQTLPMGRIATPSEVAQVIAFLMSDGASYINGANIPITGGQVA